MLMTDSLHRVLVLKPTYKPRWELPGGAIEGGESPASAAARECAEELGLSLRPGRLLVLDYVPDSESRTEGLIVVFDGGTLEDGTGLRLPPDELSAAEFVEPKRLASYLPELQTRRAKAALRARAHKTAIYLENGYVPGDRDRH